MSTPSFVTNENVKFDKTTMAAVVLRNIGGVRSLIQWDSLSAADQQVLTTFINNNGGTTPIVSTTAGKLTLNLASGTVSGSSTGLSPIAAATAGNITIGLGGTAVAGNSSGLSSASGTNGSHTVNYQPGVTTSTTTGLVAPTSGYQIIHFANAKTGTSPTGLLNDATVHTSTITVDGVVKTVSVAGSAAQTFTTLIAAINTALGSAATAALVGGDIKITSATTSTTSTVVAVTGTLFGALTDFSVIQAYPGTGSNTPLTATITIDGAAKPVSVLPSDALTFGAIIAALSSAIGASGTVALIGGDIRITSASSGVSSRVVVTAGTLFPALAGYVGQFPAASGGGLARQYSMTVVVDGTIFRSVMFTGSQGDTFQHVIDQFNIDLGPVATAALVGGNIVITSATTGTSSSIHIRDTGFLANSLTGHTGINTRVAGTAPTTYNAVVIVNKVSYPLAIVGSAAQTYGTLITAINTALGSAATAALVGNSIVITSATTGSNSSVSIVDSNLLKNLSGFVSVGVGVSGAADMLTTMKSTRSASGTPLSDTFKIITVGTKPAVPPNVKHALPFVYYSGGMWKYLDDDTQV